MYFDEKVILAVVGGGFLRTPYLHAVNELPDNVDQEFDCELSGQIIHIPAAMRVSALSMDNPPFRRVVLTAELTHRVTTSRALAYNQEQAGITFGFHEQPHHSIARAFTNGPQTPHSGAPALYLDVLESNEIADGTDVEADPVHNPSIYYPFNEEDGATTVEDKIGNNDGIISGSPEFVVGRSGNAIRFSLSNPGEYQYVDTSENIDLIFNDTRSVSMWILLEAIPTGNMRLVGQLDGGDVGRAWMYITTDLRLASFIGGQITQTAAGAIPVGQWTHVAMIAYAGSCRLWVNGVRLGYEQHNRFFQINSAPLRIGNNKTLSDTDQFIGIIEDFALFDYALTEQQVKDIFNGGSSIGYRIDGDLKPGKNPTNPTWINSIGNENKPSGFLLFISRSWKDERHVEPRILMDHQVPLQFDQEFDSIPLLEGQFHLTLPVYGARGTVRAWDGRMSSKDSGRTLGGGFIEVLYDIHGSPYLEIHGDSDPSGILVLCIEDDSGQFFSRNLLIEGVIPNQTEILLPAQRIGTPVKILLPGLGTIEEEACHLPVGVAINGDYLEGTPEEYGPTYIIGGTREVACNDAGGDDCPDPQMLALFAVNRPPRTLMKIQQCHGTVLTNDNSTGEYYAIQYLPYGISMVYGGWAYRACRRFSSSFRYPRLWRIPYVYGWGNRRSGYDHDRIMRTQVLG